MYETLDEQCTPRPHNTQCESCVPGIILNSSSLVYQKKLLLVNISAVKQIIVVAGVRVHNAPISGMDD